MISPLTVEPLCNQNEGRSQCFQLRAGRVLVNGVNTFGRCKHKWYDDEEIHGIVSVAEIVETDESLKILLGIGDDLLRGWVWIVLFIEQRLEDGEYEVMIVDTDIVSLAFRR